MYDDFGNLNYDLLLVDFYSSTDNWHRNEDGDYVFDELEDYDAEKDNIDGYDYYKDISGNGVFPNDTIPTTDLEKDRMSKFLGEHGINFTVSEYNQNEITPENYAQYAAQGDVIINCGGNLNRLHPEIDRDTVFYMWTTDGERVSCGGHVMSVTGVTDDGRFIVSSWGEQYYIDPKEVQSPSFMVYTIY